VRAGAVADEALADLYAEAHALVTPSACESFGIPAAEAMRAGLPVVAADEPWARELGRDAIVLARPEAGAVAAAVRTLEDEAEWRRRSLAGVEVASGYTWRGTAAGLAAAAREALAA
jgi:alpha-1,3-rhamnosyl/mannosyltransferase